MEINIDYRFCHVSGTHCGLKVHLKPGAAFTENRTTTFAQWGFQIFGHDIDTANIQPYDFCYSFGKKY